MSYEHSNSARKPSELVGATHLKGNGRALVVEEPVDNTGEKEGSGVENLEDVLAVENIGEPKSKKTKTK